MSALYESKVKLESVPVYVEILSPSLAKLKSLTDDPLASALLAMVERYESFEVDPSDKVAVDSLKAQATFLDLYDPEQAIKDTAQRYMAEGNLDAIMKLTREVLPTVQTDKERAKSLLEADILEIEQARVMEARSAFGDGLTTSSGKSSSTRKVDPDSYLPYPEGSYRARFPYDRNRRTMTGIWESETVYRVWKPINGQTWAIAYNSESDLESPAVKSPSAFRKVMDCIRQGLPVSKENLDAQTLGIGTRFPKETGRIGGSYCEIFTDAVAWERARVKQNKESEQKAKKSK